MIENKIVFYGSDSLQSVKIFSYKKERAKSLVFVHGGAWRDPSNTFDDFDVWAKSTSKMKADYNLFGINYRLSPEYEHPVHLWDFASALSFLMREYNVNEIVLVGHSVGATLCLQLLNFKQIIEGSRSAHLSDNELANRFATLEQISSMEAYLQKLSLKRIVLLDGIYHIPKLIEEYGPSYKSFVDAAFSSDLSYTEALQTSSSTISIMNSPFYCYLSRFNDKDSPLINIYQSLQDELLSPLQLNLLAEYFDSNGVKYSLNTGDWGKHEEVYKNIELLNLIIHSSEG